MLTLNQRLAYAADNAGVHLDANETATFTRQLEYVQSTIYTREYSDLLARKLFPADPEPGIPEAYSKVWRLQDSVGRAAQIHDYSKDFPSVEIFGEELIRKLFGWGVSFGYSFEDLKRATMAGTNLEMRKANAARRSVEEAIERIAYNGDTSGLPGLMNTIGVLAPAAAAGGAWSTKTAAQIVADIRVAINLVGNTTNRKRKFTNLLTDTVSYLTIQNQDYVPPGGTTSTKTTLQYIQENLGIQVDSWPMLDLDTAASAPKKVFFEKNPDVLSLAIQRDFTQESPRVENLAVRIPCHIKTSGLEIKQPKGVGIMAI